MDPSNPTSETAPTSQTASPTREGRPSDAGSQPGDDHPVILFDGVCNLCNAMVRWVVERDAGAQFLFVPLQSETARWLLEAEGVATPAGRPDTIVLVDQDGVHFRSSAAIRVAKRLDFPWSLLGWLSVAPRPLRDAAYDFVARNRYRWFGRSATCPAPSPDWDRAGAGEARQ